MYSRWFNVAVVVLWLSTMSWLVQDKVLPLLLIGEPPRLPELVDSQLNEPPVGWEIFVDDKSRGWALSETRPGETGLRDIRGRMHFDEFPLSEVMPGLLQPLTKMMGKTIDELRIDARSVLSVDSFGHLICFESSLRLNNIDELIGMRGTVDQGQIQVKIRAGGLSLEREFPYPANALPNDFFSPQAALPGLYAGRSWSVPVYSPLIPSKNPIKIVHAKVEGLVPITHGDVVENVWLVVYRNDTGGDSGNQRDQLGKLWVRRDGAVIKQQAKFSNTTVTFVRMDQQRTEELIESAGDNWWMPDNQAWMDINHD
ncbi:MAG: hypothetical protein GX594_14755 [Pirellulaceae bacterium]|nr:hypothetical protein [Pirellulaceae bacterium]